MYRKREFARAVISASIDDRAPFPQRESRGNGTSEGRRRNREDVSYNLLWGQLALTIFLVACAVLAVRQRMGL